MRRINLRAAGLVVVAIGLIATSACAANQDSGDTEKTWCGKKIGIFGAFTGPDSALVIPSLQGAQLRFKQYNDANPDCELKLELYDTQGATNPATTFANQVVADPDFLGVIGGHFSGETAATQPTFKSAGVAMIATSATRVDLTHTGFDNFFRVNGNDATQMAALGKWLKSQSGAKVFMIDDGAPYGAGLTEELGKALGDEVPFAGDKIQPQQTQFPTTINKIKSFGPTHIFYGGYPREGSPLFREIRANGIEAQLLGADGLYDPDLGKNTEGAAVGALVTCPCIPAEKAGGTFAADYKAEYGTDPGTYAAEAYDAATIFINLVTSGKVTRADVLAGIRTTDLQGVSKHIKFDANGDVDPSVVEIWQYEITLTGLNPIQPLSAA